MYLNVLKVEEVTLEEDIEDPTLDSYLAVPITADSCELYLYHSDVIPSKCSFEKVFKPFLVGNIKDVVLIDTYLYTENQHTNLKKLLSLISKKENVESVEVITMVENYKDLRYVSYENKKDCKIHIARSKKAERTGEKIEAFKPKVSLQDRLLKMKECFDENVKFTSTATGCLHDRSLILKSSTAIHKLQLGKGLDMFKTNNGNEVPLKTEITVLKFGKSRSPAGVTNLLNIFVHFAMRE